MIKQPIIAFKQISKSYDGEIVLHPLDLAVEDGEFLTLLGPSGCGKTTLLRILAGFETADSGQVFLNGQEISQQAPEERHVNMVFQSYALFPHMSVFDNVAFGLKCQNTPKEEIPGRVMEALARVKLSNLANRMPDKLSGGQQQRVAIARALVKEPKVLLLDEPLSALDYHLRKNMQIELKALQRKLGITFIFVTHDQEEALSLSDRIAVMDHGRIEQLGTPRDIYEEPINLHVAGFIGEANIFKTRVITANAHEIEVKIAEQVFKLKPKKPVSQNMLVNIIVRPEDIQVWGRREIPHSDDMMDGKVVEVIYKGSTVDLKVQLSNRQIISATQFFDEDDENLFYEMGELVWVQWKLGWEVILPA